MPVIVTMNAPDDSEHENDDVDDLIESDVKEDLHEDDV